MAMHRARAVMAANHGLLTRAQALDAGLSPSTIRHLVNTGQLVILRRGIYADGEVWRALDPYRGQHRLRTRAALLTMRRSWVVSHDSSAYELELDVLVPPEPHVHITRPGFTAAWTEYGVKHHLARFHSGQVVQANGLPVLDLARTAVDIAREHGTPYGEAACDSAMRKGVSKAALEEACAPMKSWPHIVRTRQAVDFARPSTGSVAETLGRLLVCELGLEAHMEIQFPVRRPDGGVAWLDIVIGCHGFEVDGKTKYVPVDDGGLATRPPFEVLWAEKHRERDLHRTGIGTSRIFFEDYWGDRRAPALKRMREEYDDTAQRFGTQLPERLIREAREIRGQAGA
jgi:Transcriptional regulator, AbiEi antitoxin